jgi:hypothetical protein
MLVMGASNTLGQWSHRDCPWTDPWDQPRQETATSGEGRREGWQFPEGTIAALIPGGGRRVGQVALGHPDHRPAIGGLVMPAGAGGRPRSLVGPGSAGGWL